MNEQRRTCSYCSRKRNKSKMYEVFYPLIHKNAWHCINCYEQIENGHLDFANNITLLAALKEEEKRNPKPPFTINEAT